LKRIASEYVGGDSYNKAMKGPFSAELVPALAGALAVVGLEFFLGVAVVLQFLRMDHDWVTAPLSFYLLGPDSAWLITAYFVLALAMFLVGLGFHLDLATAARNRLALGLFALAGISVCVVALAHTDLPGVARLTPEGELHNAAAILAFLSASLGMLLQSWQLRLDPRWRERHRKALLLAVLSFAMLWVYALVPGLPRGATEKFVILLIVLWFLMMGRWLTLTWMRYKKT
jgi:hypothetical membrane protein